MKSYKRIWNTTSKRITVEMKVYNNIKWWHYKKLLQYELESLLKDSRKNEAISELTEQVGW